MSEELIAQQIKDLQFTVKKQQHEIERLHAINEVQNLISKYAYLHANGRHQEYVKMYSNRPDTRVHWGSIGYFEGSDAAKRSWGYLEGDRQPGTIMFHPLLCPMIIVAGDGKTAKGVWTDFGFECGRDRSTGELQPNYCWGIYSVDFIKENGIWKFWHCHVYPILMHPVNVPWTTKEGWDPDKKDMELPPDRQPDGADYNHTPYRTDAITTIQPDPDRIQPYETWGDTEPA